MVICHGSDVHIWAVYSGSVCPSSGPPNQTVNCNMQLFMVLTVKVSKCAEGTILHFPQSFVH